VAGGPTDQVAVPSEANVAVAGVMFRFQSRTDHWLLEFHEPRCSRVRPFLTIRLNRLLRSFVTGFDESG
jgi:hypothetical protein